LAVNRLPVLLLIRLLRICLLAVSGLVSAGLGVTLLGIALLLIVAVWFLPLGSWLHMHAISPADTNLIVLLLGLAVLLGMQETLFQAAFRCVGKYPLGTMAKSLVVLAAFLSTMLGVGLHLSPVPVTVLYVAVNAVGVLALWILLRREVPWIRFGIRHAQWAVIRRLTGPAFSYMSFPLVNALNLQGILVVIGYVMGPVAVVTFNTARTISRSVAQGMNLINNSIWPEMSAAFGVGAMEVARMLHRRACQISLLLCLGITLGVAFLGDWIWRVWTVGKESTNCFDNQTVRPPAAAIFLARAFCLTPCRRKIKGNLQICP